MLVERKIRQTTNEVHLGFNEQRQPLLRGDAYHYLIARGDQLAFAAEVVHFGFSPPILLSRSNGCLASNRVIRWRRISR